MNFEAFGYTSIEVVTSTVWFARHPEHGEVALRALAPSEDGSEVAWMAALESFEHRAFPKVVAYHSGEEGGPGVVATRWVEGVEEVWESGYIAERNITEQIELLVLILDAFAALDLHMRDRGLSASMTLNASSVIHVVRASGELTLLGAEARRVPDRVLGLLHCVWLLRQIVTGGLSGGPQKISYISVLTPFEAKEAFESVDSGLVALVLEANGLNWEDPAQTAQHRLGTLDGLLAALILWLSANPLDGAGRGMYADEALERIRDVLAGPVDPRPTVAVMLARQPELIASDTIRDYIWGHIGASVMEDWRVRCQAAVSVKDGKLSPLDFEIVKHLPQAAAIFAEIALGADHSPASKAVAAALLSQAPTATGASLVALLNAPWWLLGYHGKMGLERRSPAQPIGISSDGVTLVPCRQRWSEMAPVEGSAGLRMCGGCDKPVALVSNLEEMRRMVVEGCAAFAPELSEHTGLGEVYVPAHDVLDRGDDAGEASLLGQGETVWGRIKRFFSGA